MCGGCGCGSGCGTYTPEEKAKWLEKKEKMLKERLEWVQKERKEVASK